MGEAYNITSHSRITQHEFIDLLADAIGVPRVTWHYPFWYAFYGGLSLEIRERLLRARRPPRVTRYGAWLLGRYLEYSTQKGPNQAGLGSCPDVSGEHRANGALVSGRRAGAGAPRPDASRSLARESVYATSKGWRWCLGVPLPRRGALAADRQARLAEPAPGAAGPGMTAGCS